MLKIKTVPDPFLKKKTKRVTCFDKSLKKIAAEMLEFLKKTSEPTGVGLAANQIGIDKRIILITRKVAKRGEKGEIIPLINPEIVFKLNETAKSWEGCLSVPEAYGNVIRAKKIKVKYQDLKGKQVEEKFEYFSSYIVAHEIDHINGILFTQRIVEQGGKIYKPTGEKNEKDELILEEVVI